MAEQKLKDNERTCLKMSQQKELEMQKLKATTPKRDKVVKLEAEAIEFKHKQKKHDTPFQDDKETNKVIRNLQSNANDEDPEKETPRQVNKQMKELGSKSKSNRHDDDLTQPRRLFDNEKSTPPKDDKHKCWQCSVCAGTNIHEWVRCWKCKKDKG